MKRHAVLSLVIFSLLFSVQISYSLTPFWFNGVALDAEGEIRDNATVNVRVSIYQGETQVSQEIFSGVITSDFAIFSVQVGSLVNISAINAGSDTRIHAEVQDATGAWILSSVNSLAYAMENTTVMAGNIDLDQHHIIIGDMDDLGEAKLVGGDLTATNSPTNADFQINAGAVGTPEIADDAVTLSKIAHTTNYQFLIAYSGVPTWSGLLRNNSLAGDGISSALGFNLANTNMWTGTQTFSDIVINDLNVTGTNNLVLDYETPGAMGDIAGSYISGLTIKANSVGSPEIIDGGINSIDIANQSIYNTHVNNNASIAVTKLQAGSHRQVILNNNGTNMWMQLPAQFVTVVPIGGIGSSDVQNALKELDDEKQDANATLQQLSSGTWSGSTSISSLGTITSGTWQGSALQDNYVSNVLTIGAGSAISGTSILGGSISGTSISGGSISASSISGGAISGTPITGGSIIGTPISGGSINGTPIGSGTRSSGAFTSLNSDGNTEIGNASTDKLKINAKIESDMLPDNAADREIGKSTDTERWKKAYFKQTGGINIGSNADNVEIQYTANSHAKVTKPVAVPSAVIPLTSNTTYSGTPEAGLILYVYNPMGVPYTFQGITVANGTMKVFVFTGSVWIATN